MNKMKITRVVILILALVNVVLASFGLSPIDLSSAELTAAVNDLWVVVSALWCCWKNFSVTDAHLKADSLAEHIKRGAEIVIEYKTGGEIDPDIERIDV